MHLEATYPCPTCPAEERCAFCNLPEPLYRELERIAEIRVCSPGVTVVRQGDEADGVLNLRSGAVRLLRLTSDGKSASVGLLAPGGMLGLTEVNTGSTYPFTAETVRRSTFEYVPRRRFVAFLLDHRQVAVTLLIWLCQEYEDLQGSLCDVAARPQLGIRLLEHLRQLGQICGRTTADGIELTPLLTGQDLADGLGCSRQWVSKLLGDLEHQDLIRRRGRRILITPAALGDDPGGDLR